MLKPFITKSSTSVQIIAAAAKCSSHPMKGKLPEWAQTALDRRTDVKAMAGALHRLHLVEVEDARQGVVEHEIFQYMSEGHRKVSSQEIVIGKKQSVQAPLWQVAQAIAAFDRLLEQTEARDNRRTMPKSHRSKGKERRPS